jgi:hypothetical protein
MDEAVARKRYCSNGDAGSANRIAELWVPEED